MFSSEKLKVLIDKYSGALPRYTSYPTALELKQLDDFSIIDQALSKIQNQKLSLYVHLPFCPSLCYFCACNKIITQDTTQIDHYLKFLEKEILALMSRLAHKPSISQLHLGGGSPSYLSPVQIDRLCHLIFENFNIEKTAALSVELDPRTTTENKLEVFSKWGFKRGSLGVQDFDSQVQEIVNRQQSLELVEKTKSLMTKFGFNNINFDLIYGLPGQSLKSLAETLQKVISLKPDKLALYAYAHVNWKTKVQNVFHKHHIPNAHERIDLFLLAQKILTQAGYLQIGLDHFCLPDDEFVAALDTGKLRRNFMGYTIIPADGVLGLGVSAISDLNHVLFQNFVKLEDYQNTLEKNKLPIAKLIARNDDDIARANMIESLMSFYQFTCKNDLEQSVFDSAQEKLQLLVDDGFVLIKTNSLEVTDLGKFFLRNIAACFDAYLDKHQESNAPRFSQAL